MAGVFNFALQSIKDIEEEYKAREVVFSEILFLKELEVCITMHEAVKDLGIDEFRSCFTIENPDKEEGDGDNNFSHQYLILTPGIYFDIKSTKHNIDYFTNDPNVLDHLYCLDAMSQLDYGPRILDDTNNPVFAAIQKLHKTMTNLMQSDNEARYLLDTNLGLALKPDLGDIILKLCGERKFNIWKSAVEKKELEGSIELSSVVVGSKGNKL